MSYGIHALTPPRAGSLPVSRRRSGTLERVSAVSGLHSCVGNRVVGVGAGLALGGGVGALTPRESRKVSVRCTVV